MSKKIPFNKPYLTGDELISIKKAHANGQLAGDGTFTRIASETIRKRTQSGKVLLTHSCTAALEMCAILSEINIGDEVIMPSFTFVSTANAIVSRGGVPVFVDVREDTLNLNENLIEDAITSRTIAIIAVHYAGVACEMDKIIEIARKHQLLVIEDAAQGFLSKYKDNPLGSIGELGTLSFHETKNIHSGEGGALLINREKFIERAEIIREKGTNRTQFNRGQIDKYKWVDIGSSYLPGEITAAFLNAQLNKADYITEERLKIWNEYHQIFEDLEKKEKIRRPIVPLNCDHNGHIYYILLNKSFNQNQTINLMNEEGVNAVFHYQPLHISPAGERYGRYPSPLTVTEDICMRLVRMPIWIGFNQHDRVHEVLNHL